MPGNVRYATYSGSNKGPPSRAKSLDCLDDQTTGEKPHEYIPSRITRMAPKSNETAMQFVKTGPANLYKSATEQIKKSEAVKAMRKHLIAEEEEWQEQPSSSSSSSKSPLDEDTDWQSVNAQVFEIASKLEETPLLGSPILKAPTLPLPIPPTQEEDSLEAANPYTDDDINEVISDYEQVGSYGDSSDHAENIYENITDEPMYENIYEKVNEDNFESEPLSEPHYQTLEEVREEVWPSTEEVKAPASPVLPAPVEPPVVEAPEVLDVTWTDGPSQAAPPSEPPPPPPPDDESDEDASEQLQSLPAEEEDAAFTRENSTRRIKKELWRRRSDFLGTSSQYIEEEPAVKPPPDLSDFLRKECEVDRVLMESQQSKISTNEVLNEEEINRREREIIENLERSEQLQKEQNQSKFTWEDRMQQDEGPSEDASDSDEHLQYQMAKNQQTSSESNMDAEVALMVPEASPNIPESSHSVSETTDSELKQMEFDNIKNNPQTTFSSLNSTVNTEDTQAEVLERHVVEAQTVVEEVALRSPPLETESQSQVETECKLIPAPSDQYSDHLVVHTATLDYSSDSVASTSSLPDEYKKLAELEEEMMRHDKNMLQRAGKLAGISAALSSQSAHIPPPSPYASQEDSSPNVSTESAGYNFQSQPTNQLPIQEFYTAPTYDLTTPTTLPLEEAMVNHVSPGQNVVASPAGSPSQYSTLASPHPFNRSHSQMSIGGAPIHPPLQGVKSSPITTQRDPAPEPLPRKKKLPPPLPNKPQQTSELNTVERLEAIRLSRMPTSDNNVIASDQAESQGQSVSPSGQQMSKQTLLALSAIPKPRLTDNESWITKKKPDTRRDYSTHWLHQEAEQRRVEQQDRINRYKPAASQSQPQQQPSSQTTSPQCTSPQHISPSQSTNFLPTQNTATLFPQNTAPTYSSYPQSLKNPSLSQSNNSINNNNSNNSWRNQATTYQPPMPAPTPTGDKALPDSIIHNLTQRVNNKNNNKNTYNNNTTNGRLGNTYGNNNYRDENYHDYMNADALSAQSSHAPLYQSATGPGQSSPPITQQQDSPSAQDQRLLSVSGKKKCSHCSEELGRGAAMIIESLRLFYHIPCFKCCVCGIQLGNGSAGADVRVRNHKLHCHNCYSNDEGMKFSKV